MGEGARLQQDPPPFPSSDYATVSNLQITGSAREELRRPPDGTCTNNLERVAPGIPPRKGCTSSGLKKCSQKVILRLVDDQENSGRCWHRFFL